MFSRLFALLLLTTLAYCQDNELTIARDPVCACFALYDPVCGIDNNTYSNSCHADCGNIKIACKGPCPCEDDCKEIVVCKRNPCDITKCEAFPKAECRPNKCNGCLAEFFVRGIKVNCKRSFPPCPPYRTHVYCPNPCPGPGCPRFPDAKCRRKNCYGCTPEYYVGDKIVDCECTRKPRCRTNKDCCGGYCCKCGRSGVYDPKRKPPTTGYCVNGPGACLCPPTTAG